MKSSIVYKVMLCGVALCAQMLHCSEMMTKAHVFPPGTTIWMVLGDLMDQHDDILGELALLDTDTIASLVDVLDASASSIIGAGVNIQSTLDMVKNNGALLNQAISKLDQQDHKLTACCSVLDANDTNIMNAVTTSQTAVTNQIAACCDEISENSATLSSAVEQLQTTITAQLADCCSELSQGEANTRSRVENLAVSLSNQLTDCCSELSQDNAAIFSAVDTMEINISNQFTECCNELSQDDAKLFSIVDDMQENLSEQLVELSENDAKIFSIIDTMENNFSAQLTELSENDAKIFSVVEQLENSLGSATMQAKESRETTIVAPSTPQRNGYVRFIKGSHLTRAGGITIDEPGLYMLTESLTIDTVTGITITANNVTLDMNGFTITTTSNVVSPVTIWNADTVRVRNGVFVGGQGIAVNGSQSVTLENLTVTYPTQHGIQMTDVERSTLVCCTVSNGNQSGIVIDGNSKNITIKNSAALDCQGSGFDLQAQNLLVAECNTQHNGNHGIALSASTNAHVIRALSDNNSTHGIFVAADVEHIHVESCRVLGNGGIGCLDNGASCATWMNNLASGNTEADYQNIKAVLLSKATSFWHNVYAN